MNYIKKIYDSINLHAHSFFFLFHKLILCDEKLIITNNRILELKIYLPLSVAEMEKTISKCKNFKKKYCKALIDFYLEDSLLFKELELKLEKNYYKK